MLANTMHSAAAHALRACGRTVPAAKSLTITSAASRALLVRPTFLITPSYKGRIAARGYATARATKKAPATKTKPRTASAGAKKAATKKAPVKAKAKAKTTKKPVKAKAKPKAKPKKKAAVKKPVAKAKKPKKQPSEEKKLATLKRGLKEASLYGQEPQRLPQSAWVIYISEHFQKLGDDTKFADRSKVIAASYKNISASEKSRLEQKARENAAINAANLKKWVESHAVADIVKANNARARLLRNFKAKGLAKSKLAKIQDERIPKRPVSAFSHFVKSQLTGQINSGFSGEAMKTTAAQWKALSDPEKKPFLDLSISEHTRYLKEREASGLYL